MVHLNISINIDNSSLRTVGSEYNFYFLYQVYGKKLIWLYGEPPNPLGGFGGLLGQQISIFRKVWIAFWPTEKHLLGPGKSNPKKKLKKSLSYRSDYLFIKKYLKKSIIFLVLCIA
jgi:hypothetical protein